MVYFQRTGTPDIFKELLSTGRKEILLSIVCCIRKETRFQFELISKRFNNKLVKLSEIQDKFLWNGAHNDAVTLNDVERPKFILDVISLVPRHPS